MSNPFVNHSVSLTRVALFGVILVMLLLLLPVTSKRHPYSWAWAR